MGEMGERGSWGSATRREFLKMTGTGLAGLSVMDLAACGNGSSGSAGKGSVRVAFLGSQNDANKIQGQIVGPFKAKHPGANIQFVAIPATEWNDFFTKIVSQIAAGNPPDVTVVATEGLQLFAAKGLAQPLDDYVKRDKDQMKEFFADVHPALVEAMMYQGHLYNLPTDFNAANMFYDTQVLDQAGISRPDPGWSKDDFYNIVSRLKNNKNVAGYAWVVRLWGSWTPWVYNNGVNLLSESRWPGGSWMWDTFYSGDPAAQGRGGGYKWGEPTVNDPAVVDALQFMVDLHQQGISPVPDTGGGGTLQGLFSSGHIMMTPGGGFWAGGLHNAGMSPTQFDVQFFPKWKSQRHLFGTAGYAMMKAAKDKDLAWEFLKFLASKDAMSITLQGNGTTPTRKSFLSAQRYAPTGPAHWQVFYDTLTQFPDTAPIPAPPYYDSMATVFNNRTTEAFSGHTTAKQALDDLQRDLEQLYAKNK